MAVAVWSDVPIWTLDWHYLILSSLVLHHTKRATVDEDDHAHEEEDSHAHEEEHGEEQEVCDPFPRLQRVVTHTGSCTLI